MRSPLSNTPKLRLETLLPLGAALLCDSVGAPIMDHYALGVQLGLA